MDIGEYQRWFAQYDHSRALDLVEPSQVTVHLVEEIGEIAREVLYLEGYRNPADRDNSVERLSYEIGDALVFLTKLALHYGISLDDVVHNVMKKAESRWPQDKARQEMARYIEHQTAACADRAAAWQERIASDENKQDKSG